MAQVEGAQATPLVVEDEDRRSGRPLIEPLVQSVDQCSR
jgi:hypothetical protein